MSTLASTQAPLPASASRSSTGESCLHGPHQVAHRSTTTGTVIDRSSTSAWKLAAASGYQSFVPFTVSSPTTAGKVVLVEPEMDWQAYNTWGGYSLYEGPPGQPRSWAVSFDRPNVPPGGNRYFRLAIAGSDCRYIHRASTSRFDILAP